jgi:hypothetical protein
VPKVRLRLADEAAATRLLKRLLARVPPIHADPSEREAGIVVLSPVALGAGEAETVARAVAESLGRTG